MRELLVMFFITASVFVYLNASVAFGREIAGPETKNEGAGAYRLADTNSPYLRAHADNPVNWRPWGEEAFAEALREDKPVFLSIGYSACHWCHVMEEESFMDQEVAALLNRDFIPILVDREKRPDIDNVYKLVSVLLTGRSGWPLNIVMTPGKRPFYAATYIPKTTRFGQPGMVELLTLISRLWREKRGDILSSAGRIEDVLHKANSREPGGGMDRSIIKKAYTAISEGFDEQHGGFGEGPKFHNPQKLMFLLRYWKRTGDNHALLMVGQSLSAMRRGGIYDQLGYGFHRYATDVAWRAPHFEKMLYDQAMLAIVYTEAFQATGKQEYAATAHEIFEYLVRDMRSNRGGFYGTQDADSMGKEGTFYLWTFEEIDRVLTKSQLKIAEKLFNISPDGNYRDEITGGKTGKNVLYMETSFSELAKELKIPEEQLVKRAETIRKRLYKARKDRERPLRDEKILTDWNGLAVAAFAVAARAFDNEEYAHYAREAADFVIGHMVTSGGRLLHSYYDHRAEQSGNIDDYAFFIWGLIELYEATFDTKYLKTALDLNRTFQRHFRDEENGGFFFTADDAQTIIIRQKEIYGGPYPSGNSVAMYNMLRLGRMTAETDLEETAREVETAFSVTIRKAPQYYPNMLSALDFALGPSYEVVIVGKSNASDTRRMFRAVREKFLPNKVVLFRPDGEDAPEILQIAGYMRDQTAIRGKATAYVCQNNSCNLPTTDIDEMLEQLVE